MDDRLVKQLRLLKQYVEILYSIRHRSKEEYLKDEILRGATERYLQLSIETCINIGNRILSLEQFNHHVIVPESYADIFETMGDMNIIDRNFTDQLKNMARFRNRLVHAYWDLDNEFVYNLLQTHLCNFTEFMTIIANYLKEKHPSDT